MSAHLMLLSKTPERLRELVTRDRTMPEDNEMGILMRVNDNQYVFVDQYNRSNVLGQLGLSWWRDVVPLLNENFVLAPEACDQLATQIIAHMPPEPKKVLVALGEGTELTHTEALRASLEFPVNAIMVIRPHSAPYTARETADLYFHIGCLVGLLHRASTEDGLLCCL